MKREKGTKKIRKILFKSVRHIPLPPIIFQIPIRQPKKNRASLPVLSITGSIGNPAGFPPPPSS
jgi:hypothetical protein